MTVSLLWQGPFGVNAIPRDPFLFENLCQAGCLPEGQDIRLRSTGSLMLGSLHRCWHDLISISSMLALATPLRDPSGEVVFSADAGVRLEAFKDLDRYSSLACDDVRRVLFFYAKCDNYFHNEHLNLVEALLQIAIER